MKPRVATVPILMLLPQTLPTPLRAVPKQWSGPSTSCASSLATGSPSQLSSPRSKSLPLPVDLTSVVRVQASANAKIRKLVGTGAVEAVEAQAVVVPLAWFEVAVTLHSDVIVTANENENATATLRLHQAPDLQPDATALLPHPLVPVTVLVLALVAVVDTADAHPPI